MAWKAGDLAAAFILTVAGGEAFAIRPAVLSRLLGDKQAAAALAADSDEELAVAPHECDAEVVSEGEEAGEEAEEAEEEGGDEGRVTEAAAITVACAATALAATADYSD